MNKYNFILLKNLIIISCYCFRALRRKFLLITKQTWIMTK